VGSVCLFFRTISQKTDAARGGYRKGLTENAGVENEGGSRGWKAQEWKTREGATPVEITGVENGKPNTVLNHVYYRLIFKKL